MAGIGEGAYGGLRRPYSGFPDACVHDLRLMVPHFKKLLLEDARRYTGFKWWTSLLLLTPTPESDQKYASLLRLQFQPCRAWLGPDEIETLLFFATSSLFQTPSQTRRLHKASMSYRETITARWVARRECFCAYASLMHQPSDVAHGQPERESTQSPIPQTDTRLRSFYHYGWHIMKPKSL